MDKTTEDMKVGPLNSDYTRGYLDGKKSGATVENERNESLRMQLEAQDANVEILLAQKNDLIERAQKLVEALEAVLPYLKAAGTNGNHWGPQVKEALQQWKGEKEVRDGIH